MGETLTAAVVGADGPDAPIGVGEPAWFAWLATARTFRYEGASGHFTARREAASHGRGGSYWKAYRRSNGKLRRAYLGWAGRLTIDRLAAAAMALARPAISAEGPESATDPAPPPGERRADFALGLLGTFSLTSSNPNQAATITSPRARALLGYLALHRDVPQSRQQIAFMLWPDSSEAQARNSLRQVVHQLRHAWPEVDRFLSARPSTLMLATVPGLTIDVDRYEHELSDRSADRATLEHAAALYAGNLLPDSYDDWIEPERERLIAVQRELLDRLIAVLEREGDYSAAIDVARRRVRLDQLDEPAYRTLMRLHVLNGDRSGALRAYHELAATLERELGVAPDGATHLAYEQIVREEPTPAPTAWPVSDASAGRLGDPAGVSIPLVGRAREWTDVMAAWSMMFRGDARLLVIRGEAGIGKSRLAASLRDWARERGVDAAESRAYEAEGRLAFAPVADWLRSPMLGASLRSLDAGSLAEVGRLMPEVRAGHPELPRPSPRFEAWQRQAFFQALVRAFFTADRPLLLILDDLQWCDADTLEWVHFLLRSDRTAQVFLVATLRPDELDERHPVTGLLVALRATGQLTEVDLGRLDAAQTTELATLVAGRALLPEEARRIQLETEGNPLFVVEVVRSALPLAERAESPSAERNLPPRVQAVIAGRLRQLSEPARELAALAATVGRAFALEVIREASGLDEEDLVRSLDELLRRQIVRQQGIGSFDFDHDKIREVAYAETSEPHRRLLHRRAAEGLERAHATALDGVSAQIASHYAEARLVDRATVYYRRAAELEQRVGANSEAIMLLRRGLALLAEQPPTPERDATELELRTTLGVSLVATEAYGAPEVVATYLRSRELCERLGQPPSSPILRALALVALSRGQINECRALGDEILGRAERDDDPILRVEGQYLVGMALQASGELEPARAHLDAALAGYDRGRSATHIGLYSQDPAVVCLIRQSLGLWLLGDSDRAAACRAESLTLAKELGHPFSLGYALTWDGILQVHRQEPELARTQAVAALALGRDHQMRFWESMATIVHGWAVAELGDIGGGIDEIESGISAYDATGSLIFKPFQMGLLAEQQGRLGRIDLGLSLTADALALAERRHEGWCEAELWRRRGDLLARASRPDDARMAFRRSAEVARGQGARALERRASERLDDLGAGPPLG